MRHALLAMCALAASLTACSPDAAPPDAVPPPRQAAVATTPPPPATAPAPTDPSPAPVPASAPVKLALSGEGLDFISERGSVRHLVFDTPAANAMDAVTRAHGGVAPQLGRNEECGAGPLDMATWEDGLTLVLQDGGFVGWSVSRAATKGGDARITTIVGIGVGSTRRELQAAYTADIRETTLGQEFAAGNVFGVLDGTGSSARIDALWAGESCNFR